MPGAKGDKENLNTKQRKFCERLVQNGYNRTEAYMYAYEVPYESANKNVAKLMRSKKVQSFIRELQEEILAQAAITPARIAMGLADIAFDEESTKAEKMKAMELLQKQYGLQRQVVDASVNGKIITVDIEDGDD